MQVLLVFSIFERVYFRGIVPITCDELFQAISRNSDGTVSFFICFQNMLLAESFRLLVNQYVERSQGFITHGS